jgi:hypothetical protein
MELRIQILAIAASGTLLLLVLEMVRRKAFLERYALLWLLSALVMLALSIWGGALESLAKLIGIVYPPNALFLVAFGFVLVLLLHFSLAVSKLSDQTKILAQRLALVEQQQRAQRETSAGGLARAERERAAAQEPEREVEEPVATVGASGRITQR